MNKNANLIGIIAGVIIIVLAIVVFTYNVDLVEAGWSSVSLVSIEGPSFEADEYYGGDAYTGMQQAAAQAANNMIPVFEEIQQGNEAIQTLNKNLKGEAEAQVENLEKMIGFVKFCLGMTLLSFGLATTAKYVVALVNDKKAEAQAAVNDSEEETKDESVV